MASQAKSLDLRGGWQDALTAQLMETGALDDAGLARATSLQEETGERLDHILVRVGIVSEGLMAQALSRTLQLPMMQADQYPDFPIFTDALAAKFVKHAQILPIGETGDSAIMLAVADPFDDATAKAVQLKMGREVVTHVAVPSELENAIERLYGDGKSSIDTLSDSLTDDAGDAADADIARLRDLANDAPVIRIVNLLIRKAVELGASDIHIEPFETQLRVRFRIDGMLSSVDAPPLRLHPAILSRIKIMAGLNIAERRLPQDGRVKAVISGREIDLRVATSPALHGESAVLRILDRSALALDFAALGFSAESITSLRALLAQPHGIVLVTGPTGSGKTTTLYAALSELNQTERKIITVEDPVEYQLDGVNQIQARPDIGLDFAHALRSILRQDPDIIMIGEIRDLETAKIAVQAALTGHLVLATLHTNTAAAAVSRLLDMGVEDYLLASTLSGVLAQRLVRNLCSDCKTEVDPLPALLAQLGDDISGPFYTANGCDACGGRGVSGRAAVTELLSVDDTIRSAILGRSDAAQLQTIAVQAGMVPMRADALAKAQHGICALDDVLRVTSQA